MQTSSRSASAAASQSSSISGIVVSPPSRLNRFWPDELGLQERLERLGLVELEQDAQLLLARRLAVRLLDALLDPAPLLGIHDVHVLDAGGAAVGVTQDAQDRAQLHEPPALAAERPCRELAVEVPHRQPVGLHGQVGVAALAVLQRVGVGHQVAAHAVGVDQLEDAGLLADLVVVGGRDVLGPADRLVGDAQRGEDLVVEVVLAQQQRVHAAQEVAGLGALDDPVVVGGGEGHHLADRVAGDGLLGRALVLGGVLHRAHADDRALALHQPRHRVVGADRAGVGQGDGRALEVLDRRACCRGCGGRCPRRPSRTTRSPSSRRP